MLIKLVKVWCGIFAYKGWLVICHIAHLPACYSTHEYNYVNCITDLILSLSEAYFKALYKYIVINNP